MQCDRGGEERGEGGGSSSCVTCSGLYNRRGTCSFIEEEKEKEEKEQDSVLLSLIGNRNGRYMV